MTADFVVRTILGVERETTPPAPSTSACRRCGQGEVIAPAKVCHACKEATYAAREQRKTEARRTRGWAKKCQRPGCNAPVTTPNARTCHTHSDHHLPPAAGRVDTYAATVTACPRCGGAILRDGRLVSCRRRLACGWVDLTSRAIRGHGVSP